MDRRCEGYIDHNALAIRALLAVLRSIGQGNELATCRHDHAGRDVRGNLKCIYLRSLKPAA